MIRIFNRIYPTPSYPNGTSFAMYTGLDWESRASNVLAFKKHIKDHLRRIQLGSCCYCRRPLGDHSGAHIEHFIEKAVFPSFTFEVRNLALSCPTCNYSKAAFTKRVNGRVQRFSSSRARRTHQISLVLHGQNVQSHSLPTGGIHYRWVHPHFDFYRQHIDLRRGWIFQPISKKGARTISGLKLNAIVHIENRAMIERMMRRSGPISLAVGALSELLDSHTIDQVCSALAKAVRERRALRSSVHETSDAEAE